MPNSFQIVYFAFLFGKENEMQREVKGERGVTGRERGIALMAFLILKAKSPREASH